MDKNSVIPLANAGCNSNVTSDYNLREEGLHDATSCRNAQPRSLNALNPACNLPVEIIGKIFVTLRNMIRETLGAATGKSRLQSSWIVVTHVCRYWRAVALGWKTLWTTLPSIGTAFTPIALARTNGAPISIEAIISSNLSAKVVKNLLAHSGRLSSIELVSHPSPTGSPPSLQEVFLGCEGFPLLEEVFLKIQSDYDFKLPFSQNCSPSLKHLTIKASSFSGWENMAFGRNMQSLILRGEQGVLGGERPTLHESLDMMAAMPLLQELDTAHLLPEPPGQTPQSLPSSSTPAILPQLAVLTLQDNSGPIAQFLQSVHFPEATMVTMVFYGTDDESSDSSAMLVNTLSRLQRTCRRMQVLNTISSMKEISPSGHGINAGESLFMNFVQLQADDSPCRIVLATPSMLIPLEEILPQVARLWSFKSLLLADAARGQVLPRSVWTSVFSQCDALNYLLLDDYGSLQNLTEVLKHRAGCTEDGPNDCWQAKPVPWLPSLQILVLGYMRFGRNDPVLSSLVKIMTRRAQIGHPIVALLLNECHNFGRYRRRFEEVPGLKVWSLVNDTGSDHSEEEEDEEDETS